MAIVYQHKKPNGEIFYIGIGVSKKRAKSKHSRNNYWNNVVKKYGYNIEILFDNIDYSEAKEIERYLIRYYGRRDLGYGLLVNLTDGGEGYLNMGKEEREKRSIRLSKHNRSEKDYSFTQSEIYKESMSIATKGKGCKKIINTDTGIIYKSLRDASKENKINYTSLSSMLNNKRPNKTSLKWI
tara:strand:+ start:763 stop:1311 length:549 start_codon:yes stop_codon:yes gene_type:complete